MVDLSRRQSERSLEAAELRTPDLVICCLTSDLNERGKTKTNWVDSYRYSFFSETYVEYFERDAEISKTLQADST